MDKSFKIKPLSKAQILISLDRLTRFKPTEEKYFRVFSEIICSNLIFPKYKKKDLTSVPYENFMQFVEAVFDFSINNLKLQKTDDFSVNKKLLQYEQSVFKFDKNVERLVNNKIDYKALMTLFENDEIPQNLNWLNVLLENKNQREERKKFGYKFPVEKIVIAEGVTEEILLPKFAKVMGNDFDKEGIYLISAGGKNQVVKLFYKYADILKLPIFVLLDSDAVENYNEITPKLRAEDEIYILKNGEFEDLIPLNLIKRTLNRHLKNFYSIKIQDLRKPERMTKVLDKIFKDCSMEFKKAEFAHLINNNIEFTSDVSAEIVNILQGILSQKVK